MFTFESEKEKEWIKTLKKERPDLDIKRLANGEYILLNKPKDVVQATTIFDLVDVHSDFDEYHTHNIDKPVLIKTERHYAITFCYYNEFEWLPIISQGRVFIFKKQS